MQLLFTRSAQLVICCETSPKTKSKLYRQLLEATGRLAAMRPMCIGRTYSPIESIEKVYP